MLSPGPARERITNSKAPAEPLVSTTSYTRGQDITLMFWFTVRPHLSSLHTCPHSAPVLTPHLSSLPTCPHSPPVLTPHLSSLPTCPHSPPVLTPHLSSLRTCPHSAPVLTPHLSSLRTRTQVVITTHATSKPQHKAS